MKSLHWKIPKAQLKSLGYKFQKLYAMNYQTYRKVVRTEDDPYGGFTIWLWVSERLVEIEDWYGFTNSILEFYKANKHLANSRGYLKIQLNQQTGFVQLFEDCVFDMETFYTDEQGNTRLLCQSENYFEKEMDKWYEKYPAKFWREILLPVELMELLLQELALIEVYNQ
jgi:hypothetical protein